MAVEGLRAGAGHAGGILREFRTFLLHGNVVELAVAVVVGVAFTSVVQALVRDLVTPLVAAMGARPDFEALSFTINNSLFRYGDFLNALVSFFLIAAVVFFFVVLPVNRLVALSQRGRQAPAPATRECPECLSRIPLKARRCAFCTAAVVPVTPDPASAG